MPYQSERQKAAHEARLFSEHMAKLRRQAVPVPRINSLTGRPLETEMAKQARRKQDELDSIKAQQDAAWGWHQADLDSMLAEGEMT